MNRLAANAADRALLLPALAFAGALLLHADRAPPWCTAVALTILLWRGAAAVNAVALPTRWLRIAITLLLVALTFGSFRTLNGLAAGSALLIVMGAVKLLESRSHRDGLIVTGAALFLLAAACLDRQSLPRLPLYALETWLACAALGALGGGAESPAPRVALRTAGRTLLLALPFALILFLFFPRLPGALWSTPANERARTGLGEEMSPGSISELTVSDEIAFRVSFEQAAPPVAQRYWRGPVLHDFDGYTWRRVPGQVAIAQPLTPVGAEVRYHVMLEPTQQNWWFALDTAARSPAPRVQLTFDQQLLAAQPVTQTISYDAQSYLETRSTAPLSALARHLDLRLPQGRNPRSLALAQQLRAAAPDDAAFVRSVLQYLRTHGFEYTLTPPLLDYDSVDDLLFNTRQGFCGHYASAFATLMRAGGVPARVVTGYLGGEWNGLGAYYAVRQSDAHAWTEVWLEGRGWTRVDPTAVVSPARLERGLRDLLPDSGSAMERVLRGSPLLGRVLQAWDAGNRWWQDRVVGFNLRAQLSLLQRLGLPDADYRALALLLAGGCGLWFGYLMWQLRRRREPSHDDPLAQAWRQLRKALTRAGIAGVPSAGPLQLARLGGDAFPHLRTRVQALALQYAELRYGPAGADAAKVAPVVRGIRKLLPRLAPRHAQHRQPGLSAEALAELRQLLPLYRRMPPVLRQRCATLAVKLQRRVHFEGCGGLKLTPLMRNAIAFQASLLVASRDLSPYRGLRSVLVYPEEFVVPMQHEDEAGVITQGEQVLSGQAEDADRVLISWADVHEGIRAQDGYNVVLHEFAHLLDPVLGGELAQGSGPAASWHEVMSAEYQALREALQAGEKPLIDPYGAEDPAEFFAVCTETFFELPQPLKAQHPRLYATLKNFYGADPADWPTQTQAVREGSFTR